LQLPRRQPAYRAGRSHAEFLRNFQVSATTLRQRVQAAWEAEASAAAPLDLVTSLVREKYGCAEWIRRR
jgi:lipoate-protein ligase A